MTGLGHHALWAPNSDGGAENASTGKRKYWKMCKYNATGIGYSIDA